MVMEEICLRRNIVVLVERTQFCNLGFRPTLFIQREQQN